MFITTIVSTTSKHMFHHFINIKYARFFAANELAEVTIDVTASCMRRTIPVLAFLLVS
jgi:hypothetical protein